MRRLGEKYYKAIAFANFCKEWRLHPRDAADLVALAKAAADAGVRECNIQDYSASPYRRRFEAQAKKCRFQTDWSGGLYASISRKRRGKVYGAVIPYL